MGGIIRAVKGFAVFACGLTGFHSRMLAAMVGRNYADPFVSLDTVGRTETKRRTTNATSVHVRGERPIARGLQLPHR